MYEHADTQLVDSLKMFTTCGEEDARMHCTKSFESWSRFLSRNCEHSSGGISTISSSKVNISGDGVETQVDSPAQLRCSNLKHRSFSSVQVLWLRIYYITILPYFHKVTNYYHL